MFVKIGLLDQKIITKTYFSAFMNLEIVWQNTFSRLSRDLVVQFQQTYFYYVEKIET